MYRELGHFLSHICKSKPLWRDGELWTALIGFGGAVILFYNKPSLMGMFASGVGDLLTVTSIMFGFVITSMTFYIPIVNQWAKDKNIQSIANKLIDWHVWTILCLFILMGYLVFLKVMQLPVSPDLSVGWYDWLQIGCFSFLVFQMFYVGGQILNHTLTVWWVFQNRDKFQ